MVDDNPLYNVCSSHPLVSSELQANTSNAPPQLLQRHLIIFNRKQRMEVTSFHTHPAPITNMAWRVEGRNAVVGHGHHRAPDALSGALHLISHECQHE